MRRCPSTEEHQWCCGRCHEEPVARLYIRCYECCHPYRTRWHLLLAYRREHARVWWREWRTAPLPPIPDDGGLSLLMPWEPWRWWHALAGWWRPSRIPFCQCCTHDF